MYPKRFHWFLLLLSLAASAPSSAQIYKTVDENGNVSFTDSPPAEQMSNTQKLQLEQTNTTAAVKAVPHQATTANTDAQNDKYSIKLTQPSNQANLTAEQRDLTIQAKVSPAPTKAHQVVINLDGESIDAGNNGSVTIHNIGRGEHKIYARLLKNGKFIASSKTITVYVFRPIKKG